MSGPEFTDRELDVMSVLWREGSGTVSEVRDRLADELAYTTVLWVLQTLEQKGHVRHERHGRAYRYYPLVGATRAGHSAVGRIVDKVYHGSAALLVAQLVEQRDLAPDELERLRELLDRRLTEGGEGDAEGQRGERRAEDARGAGDGEGERRAEGERRTENARGERPAEGERGEGDAEGERRAEGGRRARGEGRAEGEQRARAERRAQGERRAEDEGDQSDAEGEGGASDAGGRT